MCSKEGNFTPAQIKNNKETAIILFSSGTTGLPKGICISHRSILKSLESDSLFSEKLNVTNGTNLINTTLYWISGIASFIETVIRGESEVIRSKFDPYRTWELLDKYKVTFMFLSTHLLQEFILCKPPTAVPSLKVLFTGGSPPTKELIERLKKDLPNTAIINAYGQTESVGCISRFDIADKKLMNTKPLSCGKMRSRFEWKVVDLETEKLLGPNKRGELRVKSDLIMNGYYKMDASVAFDSEGYLKTGDIVYYDEDECFYVIDRIKEAFKYRGWHIIPAVVEGVLLSHRGVKEAVVIGIPHEVDGDHPMGIVVLNGGNQSVTPEEIQEYVAERVSETQKLRAGVKVVDKILRTATGKIRRADLRKLVLEGKI